MPVADPDLEKAVPSRLWYCVSQNPDKGDLFVRVDVSSNKLYPLDWYPTGCN